MSFRKRNVGLSSTGSSRIPSSTSTPTSVSPTPPFNPTKATTPSSPQHAPPSSVPGVRPSPLDGRPVTSTGTPTLDALFAGHSGLPLGTSLLIEETGTTDYAGTLLRYYAAEGVVQGHIVHVGGVPEAWGRDLPSCTGAYTGEEKPKVADEKGSKERMKIAWRYERLSEFGAGKPGARASPLPHRTASPSASTPSQPSSPYPEGYTHTFSLLHRLTLPSPTPLRFHRLPLSPTPLPFSSLLTSLAHSLASTPNSTPHRLIIPLLLSPLVYPPARPSILLPFIHALRSLLRQHPTRLSLVLSLPLSLHPRSAPLTRWIEILSDGVVELLPFQRDGGAAPPVKGEEQPQGGVRVWKVPGWTESVGGVGAKAVGDGGGEDLAFTVRKEGMRIAGWSLPPVEMDGPPVKEEEGKGKGLEF